MAGPNDEELLKLLEQCDLRASRSRSTTPCASLSPGSSMLSTNINNHRFGISNYSLTTSGGGPSIENSLDQRDPEIPTFNPRIPISYGRQVSIGRTYAPRDISEAVQQQPLSAARSRVTEEKEATKNAVTTDC